MPFSSGRYNFTQVLQYAGTLADDGYVDLPVASVSGFGQVQLGDDQAYAYIRFDSTGAVTLAQSSANVDNADTDNFLALFSNGSNAVRVKNRLGSSKRVAYWLLYYTV